MCTRTHSEILRLLCGCSPSLGEPHKYDVPCSCMSVCSLCSCFLSYVSFPNKLVSELHLDLIGSDFCKGWKGQD